MFILHFEYYERGCNYPYQAHVKLSMKHTYRFLREKKYQYEYYQEVKYFNARNNLPRKSMKNK